MISVERGRQAVALVMPEPVDPESLIKGWSLQYKGAGVQGMGAYLVQRSVPVCVDITRLWVDARETFSGMEEGVLIDRFLDTVMTRAKRAGGGGRDEAWHP